MATSPGVIAAKVVAKLKQKMPAAIRAGELFETVEGSFDATNKSRPASLKSCGLVDLIIDTSQPIGDVFADHVVGPDELLVFMSGFSNMPVKGWALQFDGKEKYILRVLNILGTSEIAYAVVR